MGMDVFLRNLLRLRTKSIPTPFFEDFVDCELIEAQRSSELSKYNPHINNKYRFLPQYFIIMKMNSGKII